MRWTIGVVLLLLKSMGFENLSRERICIHGDKVWVIKGTRNGKEYQGFGINARLAFEDLLRQWLGERRNDKSGED
ncbi:TPA: hypothetical protein EYP13_01490 [Candidatus Micrarchaeota archaeon]|nr:hypothetical protein [Candidatus Micrarchaeota archaeon]